MQTVMKIRVGALAVAIAGAGLVAALASGSPNVRPMAAEAETTETRLAAVGLRIEDAPIDVPASTTTTCGRAIFDFAPSSGPPTPREAVIERALALSAVSDAELAETGLSDTELRVGVLAPVTEGETAATWVFVPDGDTAVIRYRLHAAAGGGWYVSGAGIDC
ncbi:MAG: hypothetical protein ACI970_001642 [Myxococcota bacterium]|jgi:hypothetical protein